MACSSDVAPFLTTFFIVLRRFPHEISNLALKEMEKVPHVSRNSARGRINIRAARPGAYCERGRRIVKKMVFLTTEPANWAEIDIMSALDTTKPGP